MPAVRRLLAVILAVIVAGVVGTVANSVVEALLTGNAFLPLAVSPGWNAVAIAVAVLLPLIYAGMSGVPAAILAVVALTVIPSILAKLVFGVEAPWHFVLGVNTVYAVAAWVVYLAIAQTGRQTSGARGAAARWSEGFRP
jgi:hypothetical protein